MLWGARTGELCMGGGEVSRTSCLQRGALRRQSSLQVGCPRPWGQAQGQQRDAADPNSEAAAWRRRRRRVAD